MNLLIQTRYNDFMNSTQIEFIKERLTLTARSHEWVSVFLSSTQFNIMDLVRAVKAEGFLCQTLSSEHAERIGPKMLLQMAETFIAHKVVVILHCQNQAELKQFVPALENWKHVHSVETKDADQRGRLWILVNNVDNQQLETYMQNLADFTCQL